MSLDVFLQDFSDDAADRGDVVFPVLRAFLDEDDETVTTSDGSTEIYGLGESPLTSVLFAGPEGRVIWDVIYEVADAADWIILPEGYPAIVLSEASAASIPPELLEDGYRVVESGADLFAVIDATPEG
jgi:hypothetical protein